MLRFFLIVVGLGVLLGLGALFYIGEFPPNPQVHQVEKTLPAGHIGR